MEKFLRTLILFAVIILQCSALPRPEEEETPAEPPPEAPPEEEGTPALAAPDDKGGWGPTPPCAYEVCPQEVIDLGPLCAADNHTYPTDCHRKCWGKDVAKVHDGVCKEDAYHPEVLCLNGKCPEEIEKRQTGQPECGQDGVTYANECERYCEGNEMLKRHDGPCEGS